MTGGDFATASARARAPASDEADLRTALRSGDAPTRRDAALALVDRADEGGLEDRTAAALADRTTADPDPDVRQFAVEALGVDGRKPDTLVTALDDPDEWVRAEVVVALSRMGAAVVALAKGGDAPGSLLVDRLKNDPHPAVREYAAGFLPETDVESDRGVRLLAALLAREPNAFVRARAASSLGRYGTERAVQALESHGLEDRSTDVTRAAEHALAEARGEAPPGDGGGARNRGAPGSGPSDRRAGARGPDRSTDYGRRGGASPPDRPGRADRPIDGDPP